MLLRERMKLISWFLSHLDAVRTRLEKRGRTCHSCTFEIMDLSVQKLQPLSMAVPIARHCCGLFMYNSAHIRLLKTSISVYNNYGN